MAFSESRGYMPGDDPRHVDWNATARTGDLHVKQFVEERELTLLLAVDLSGSMSVGSASRLKRQVAAEACALLAFSALRNNDKVGLLLFTDRIERVIRPKKGRSHVLRLVRDVLAYKPQSSRTDLKLAFETVTHLSHQRAIVALVSDFDEPGENVVEHIEKPLRVLARRHDLMVLELEDKLDRALPDVGLLHVKDPETGREVLVDTSDKRVRQAFAERAAAQRASVQRHLERSGVDRTRLVDAESSLELTRFLRRRGRRVSA
jgi:uncharacterized protein (DUF58 family)